MSYELSLSWNNNEGILRLPIVPNEGITLNQPYETQSYDTMTGQLLLIGHEQLNGFSVNSFFPMKNYNFINSESGVAYQTKVALQTPADTKSYYEGLYKYETVLLKDGLSIVELIQSVNARRIPWRCVLTRDGNTIWNRAAAMTQFDWGYDNAGDITYTMSFTEYRFAERKPDELGEQSAPSTAQDVYEVETIITSDEAEAQEGTLPEGTYTKLFTDDDVHIAANAISNEFGSGTGYYIQSNGKPLLPSEGTTGTWINAKTLTAAYAWVYCNIGEAGAGTGNSDAMPGKGIKSLHEYLVWCTQNGTSATASTGTGMIAFVPGKQEPYTNSRYGFDISEIVRQVFEYYSAEKAGLYTEDTNPMRVVPKKYCSYAWNSNARWGTGARTDTICETSRASGKSKVWNFSGITCPWPDCPGEKEL